MHYNQAMLNIVAFFIGFFSRWFGNFSLPYQQNSIIGNWIIDGFISVVTIFICYKTYKFYREHSKSKSLHLIQKTVEYFFTCAVVYGFCLVGYLLALLIK